MPELPEVEHIVRRLRPELVGRTVVRAEVLWSRTVARPSVGEFVDRIQGRTVKSIGRRGKYVVIELDADWLLLHLKMSGRLRWLAHDEHIGRHTRLVLALDEGRPLCFDDARKFGRAYLVADPGQVTGTLGPEPLGDGFQLADLRRLLGRRSGRLKPVLVDQHFLAGVGNIYADEVLFRAGLHPMRPASSLSPQEQVRLYESLRCVLERAIVGHGTTLDDGGYVDTEGEQGQYQDEIAVYGRTGKPCLRCGTPIERIVIGQRSAHFCPLCQQREGKA